MPNPVHVGSLWKESWDLSTIPDETLKREWARRNGLKGGRKISNDPATESRRKTQREYRRKRRAAGLA